MSQNEKVSLARFRQDLSRSLSRRGKQLLESTNLAQAVSKLAPLETYFIVKELGIEDATPILLNASRTQIQTIIDLDCWTGDRPDPLDLDAWLAPFAALGKEALNLAFFTLDHELQIVFWPSPLIFLNTTPKMQFMAQEEMFPPKLPLTVSSFWRNASQTMNPKLNPSF